MLRINQLKMKPGHTEEALLHKAAKVLGVPETDIREFHIVKQSIDARKKPDIYYSYSVDVAVDREESLLKRCMGRQVTLAEEVPYVFPEAGGLTLSKRPVIVGMGPAGLFCGYFLSLYGYAPIILERGEDVDTRQKDVEDFWQNGRLHPNSNVQFGEGGAGTFSDGKLNTLVKDKYGRNKEVLRTLVQFGAPERILYENKPHIGTDILCKVVKEMRKTIIRKGGKVCFGSEVTDFIMENGKLQSVVINHARKLETEIAVLAIGHSARNTFAMLYEKGIPMEAKSFAVGLRVEHLQKMINDIQYGTDCAYSLPAASYKVTAQTSTGRGVYSFCMCPGGYVVNASSEEGRLAVNGMSYSGREGKNANSAIIVSVTPEDFPSSHPLAGVAFQRELEKKAYAAGQGRIPVQRYGTFRNKVLGEETQFPGLSELQPCMKGRYQEADVHKIMPQELNVAFVEAMEQFGRVMKGFDHPEVLVSGIESRTSSPVRILRDEMLQSKIKGIYPCGEGAGYAGGITSAAMDGIRIAEAIRQQYSPVL